MKTPKKKLKTAKQGAEKLMPLHQRVATGNKPVRKGGKPC